MAQSFRAIGAAGVGVVLAVSAVLGTGAVANANPVSAGVTKAFNNSAVTPLVVSPVGRAAAEAALLDPQVPIIVLGARLNPDCSAPAVLKSRVATARSLALRHPLNPIIVSGGRTQPGCQTEAEYMRDALVSMGVSKRRITMETNSDSTVGNAVGTAHFASSTTGIARAGVIVTSPRHTSRARNTYSATDNTALWLAVPSTVN
ncbi:MAG: YdcF family protein [Corynebacterium sp.]|uniref:YdcF family protein n=1 Tax=Corynebacterium sp. TaxID=1720 RepID=UPI0026DBA0F9|nr:YdcF family protein [Corynebacterium sp.]MDO5029873.1 YdcF family protein [Corynebacterium sp.]